MWAAREGVVVNAGGQKGFAFSQSFPRVHDLLADVPSFPTTLLSSQEEGQALGCQEHNPPLYSLPSDSSGAQAFSAPEDQENSLILLKRGRAMKCVPTSLPYLALSSASHLAPTSPCVLFGKTLEPPP